MLFKSNIDFMASVYITSILNIIKLHMPPILDISLTSRAHIKVSVTVYMASWALSTQCMGSYQMFSHKKRTQKTH